jgi:hypothetical protein
MPKVFTIKQLIKYSYLLFVNISAVSVFQFQRLNGQATQNSSLCTYLIQLLTYL